MAMIPIDVDEEGEHSSSTFALLVGRKRPLVLRKAAQSWGGHTFLEVFWSSLYLELLFKHIEVTHSNSIHIGTAVYDSLQCTCTASHVHTSKYDMI